MSTRMGVIGVGKWGINHIRVLSELENVKLIGLSDSNPKLKDTARQYGIKYYKAYHDLLPEVDALSIVVPTDLHFQVAKECLEAGKHVLVEKPLTPTVEEAFELLEIATKRQLVLAVGYLFRFNAAVTALKNELKNAGDIQYVTGRYIHSTKVPRRDSGVILNFGVHLIDILNYIFDRIPKSVFCKKKTFLSNDREDIAFINLDFEEFAASLEMSWLHPLKQRDLWLIGSREKIYADLFEQMITKYPIQISPNEIVRDAPINVEIRKNEPLKAELADFVRTISNDASQRTGNLTTATAAGSIITTKICELCHQSALENKELPLTFSPKEKDLLQEFRLLQID